MTYDGKDRPWRALYKTARWQRRRKRQLEAEPLCRFCLQDGRTTPANVADHIERHNGDYNKFWSGALQSLCKRCHDSIKQSYERTGLMRGTDEDGFPRDPNHPWS